MKVNILSILILKRTIVQNVLKAVYDPELFRKNGHRSVDLLADYLESVRTNKTEKVINWLSPEEQLTFWENYSTLDNDPITFFKDVIDKSIHLHNPKYMGHQVSAPAPITVLADMLTSLLNNGMAIYEMGPAASALEKWIVKQFSQRLGFGDEGDGFLTSGGTLATLTALLAARQLKTPGNVWKDGLQSKPAILVPEEAHYCVDRAARIMGFGEEGIIPVPADEKFQMRIDLLESILRKATKDGKQVIAVVANACSTSTGTYDKLVEIGRFCKKHDLWFHVDAAHGGGAIFSEKYKHKLEGIEMADSLIIDLHKMLMNPALSTIIMFRKAQDSYATFNQKAQYLWSRQEDEEWFNYAKRTMECTKLMMSVKFYSLVHTYGFKIFDQNVTTLFDLAKTFAAMIKERKQFELAVEPMANIVCFRYIDEEGQPIDQLNSQIRQSLLEDGDFYIVQTILKGETFLRVTLMNPFTGRDHLQKLLDTIEQKGSAQISKPKY